METPSRPPPNPLKQQFPHTEKWNKILNEFLTNGPRGRHRKQFSYIQNSFTGKEAVDFMLEALPKILWTGTDRVATRDQCFKLLAKLLADKHFYRHGAHEGKANIFKDNNWLYCFYSVPKASHAPKLTRTGSFNRKTENPKMGGSPQFGNVKIPSFPEEETGFNRRRSMSCSNLTDITNFGIRKQPDLDATPPCDRTRDEGIYDTFKKTVMDKITVRKRRVSPFPVLTEPKLISQAAISTPPPIPPPRITSISPPTPSTLNETELWTIYRKAVERRIEELYEESLITWRLKGKDIKWNCENIGRDGIVAPRYERDGYSDYITRLINYLMTFSNQKTVSSRYDEHQEIKVFNVLCSNLEKAPPLICDEETIALLQLHLHFKEKPPPYPYSMPLASLPLTTVYRPPLPNIYPTNPVQRLSSRDSAALSSYSAHTSSESSVCSYASSFDSDSTFRGSLCHSRYDDLPLIQNEFLSRRIDLNQTSSSFCGSSLDESASSLDEEQKRQTLLKLISLLLLTLETSQRRKLHILLRLIQKISRDENLRLDLRRSNRELVVEKFSKIIFPCGRAVTSKQAQSLLRLLTESMDEIFKIEEALSPLVKTMSDDLVNQMPIIRSPLPRSPLPPKSSSPNQTTKPSSFFQRVVRKFR